MKKLTIWHTNDIHSSFDRFGGICGYLRKHIDHDRDLLLDGGDFADEKAVIVNGSEGLYAMELLKDIGYDAIAAGNNEFFAGIRKLSGMGLSGINMLSSNITDLEDRPIEGIKPFVYIVRNGLKILIIGSSPNWTGQGGTNETVFTTMAGIRLSDPLEAVGKVLREEKGRYDLCVLLSHSGLHEDRRMAEELDGIDVIVGGHTHTLTEQAEHIRNTWIVETTRFGEYLGKTDVFIENGKVNDVVFTPLKNDFEPDEEYNELFDRLNKAAEDNMSAVLYEIKEDLEYDPANENRAVNAVADSLHEGFDSELGIVNNGILSGKINRQVSRLNLLLTAPSILNPTSVYWTGRKIREAFKASLDPELVASAGFGPGFRGTQTGALSFSWNVTADKETLEITVDGKRLEDDRVYHVVTTDYLFSGFGYPMLKGSEKTEEYFAGYVRDWLEVMLKKDGFVERTAIRRIR